ncbi:MAG: PorV/PorQ family protein [Ignavibacteria bacterium]|nr:PorV/PorQ family protein [Ignavibacteria bacterium]
MLFGTWMPAQAQLFPLLGGQRAGISSLQFLKIGAGARASGMADAFVAVADDATALMHNPAGLMQFQENQVHFSHTTWLVDLQHEFAGAVYRFSRADAVGVSFTALHTADMEVTTETQPFGTGRYFSYGDLALGLTYARALTAQFSFGATVRYVEETIDVLKTRAVLLDLGTFYRTGLGSTRFSVTVTNFGGNVRPEGTATRAGQAPVSSFQEFSPPTLFKIGFAFEPYQDDQHRVTTAVQLNHPNDNSENLALGAEYAWNGIFSVRAGYKFNVDEEGLTVGAGLEAPVGIGRARFDYAYAAFEHLNAVHRISITLGF